MEKEVYAFKDFIENASVEHIGFFTEINDLLTCSGYEPKVDIKKSGFSVSYISKKAKRTIMNYVSRKKGTYIRMYGDNTDKYMSIFNDIPDSIVKEISKANDCKRMIDPNACNSRCKKGITIDLNGEILGKCRNSALMLLIEPEKYNTIITILEHEVSAG
ncbi:MAG: hypothetical protein KAQ68_03615 [Clostridiales bacterium]|nr:hypothetical protein [Clostridiales bacterium]